MTKIFLTRTKTVERPQYGFKLRLFQHKLLNKQMPNKGFNHPNSILTGLGQFSPHTLGHLISAHIEVKTQNFCALYIYHCKRPSNWISKFDSQRSEEFAMTSKVWIIWKTKSKYRYLDLYLKIVLKVFWSEPDSDVLTTVGSLLWLWNFTVWS